MRRKIRKRKRNTKGKEIEREGKARKQQVNKRRNY